MSRLTVLIALTLSAIPLQSWCQTGAGDGVNYLTRQEADVRYDAIGGFDRWKFEIPQNWTGFRPTFGIFEHASGEFSSDFHPDSYRPAGYLDYPVYYVDWQNGKDTLSGLDRSRALRRISTALAKPGNKWILCRPGVYDLGSYAGGVEATGNVIIEPWDDSGYVVSSTEMRLTWTASAGLYSALTPTLAATVVDETRSDKYGFGRRYKPVSTLAECAITPGSFYATSSAVTVNTLDGQVPNPNLLVMAGSNNGRYRANGTFFARRVVFRGGNTPFIALGAAGSTQNVVMSECGFLYSAVGKDGCGMEQPGSSILHRCFAGGNYADGFDYKYGRQFMEIGCRGMGNGYSGTNTDNGSTAHYDCTGIQIGGCYIGNAGRNIHHIGNSRVMMLGPVVGESRGTGASSVDIAAGVDGTDATILWTIGCRYIGGSSFGRFVTDKSIIFSRKNRTDLPDISIAVNGIRPL